MKASNLRLIRNNLLNSLGFKHLCSLFLKIGITPNHLSSLNILVNVMVWFFLYKSPIIFSYLLLLHFLLDTLDGYYAQTFDKKTNLGAILDHAGDVSFSFLILIKSYFYFGYWWILLSITLTLAELIYVTRKKLTEEKFPTIIYLVFFIFGYYGAGLFFHLIYQPTSFLVYLLCIKRAHKVS